MCSSSVMAQTPIRLRCNCFPEDVTLVIQTTGVVWITSVTSSGKQLHRSRIGVCAITELEHIAPVAHNTIGNCAIMFEDQQTSDHDVRQSNDVADLAGNAGAIRLINITGMTRS